MPHRGHSNHRMLLFFLLLSAACPELQTLNICNCQLYFTPKTNTFTTPEERALFLPLERLAQEDQGAVRTHRGSRKAQSNTSRWLLTQAPHSGSSKAPAPCSALPSAPPPRRLPRYSLSLQTSFLAQKVPLLPGLMEVVVHPTGPARQHISLAATPALEDPLLPSPSLNPRGSSLRGTEFTQMSPNPSHAPL